HLVQGPGGIEGGLGLFVQEAVELLALAENRLQREHGARFRVENVAMIWPVCDGFVSAAAAIIRPRVPPAPGSAARAATPHRPRPDRAQRLLRAVGDGGDDLAQEPPA